MNIHNTCACVSLCVLCVSVCLVYVCKLMKYVRVYEIERPNLVLICVHMCNLALIIATLTQKNKLYVLYVRVCVYMYVSWCEYVCVCVVV